MTQYRSPNYNERSDGRIKYLICIIQEWPAALKRWKGYVILKHRLVRITWSRRMVKYFHLLMKVSVLGMRAFQMGTRR